MIVHVNEALYGIFWALICVPSGYTLTLLANDVYKSIYKKNMSNFSQNVMLNVIIFAGFVKGYTGNSLCQNMYNYYHSK